MTTRALVALTQEQRCMAGIAKAHVGAATFGPARCLRLGRWQARYPGARVGKGAARRRLASPRCHQHALAFCRRYGLRIPKGLAQAEAARAMRLSAVHPDPVRIRLLEERLRRWRNG